MQQRPNPCSTQPSNLSGLLQSAKFRRTILHLGNVGAFDDREIPARETKQAALRESTTLVLGIDLTPCPGLQGYSNVFQIQADFISGLQQIPAQSLDQITSSYALFYYDQGGDLVSGQHLPASAWQSGTADYHKAILDLAYEKLKVGGELLIFGDRNIAMHLQQALAQSQFRQSPVAVETAWAETAWERFHQNQGLLIHKWSIKKQ